MGLGQCGSPFLRHTSALQLTGACVWGGRAEGVRAGVVTAFTELLRAFVRDAVARAHTDAASDVTHSIGPTVVYLENVKRVLPQLLLDFC